MWVGAMMKMKTTAAGARLVVLVAKEPELQLGPFGCIRGSQDAVLYREAAPSDV